MPTPADPSPELPIELPIEWLPAHGAPEQLILLLHGWAGDAASMAPLAQALRAEFPQAAVLAPDAPHAADGGRAGRQWYSVDGLDATNWPQRLAAPLHLLHAWVGAQQRRLGVGTAATALGGFSQGAILALALAARHDGIAGRVLAFGGRFVELPAAAPRHTTLHLFHGGADRVIPAQGSRDALEHLGALQGDATLDIAEGIGHEMHPALVQRALFRLRHHIPARTWAAALGAMPAPNPEAGGPPGPPPSPDD
jgi:phospholipase/carboxylesterase